MLASHRPPARRLVLTASALALATLGSSLACGYHLTSKGSNLPPYVKTIGVPEFTNNTSRPELGQRITESVIKELARRGKYRVTSETKGADALLRGTIVSWSAKPLQLTEGASEAERVSVTLKAAVTFEDRVQRRVTWEQDAYSFTSEYDVIGDPDEYFDTELSAVDEIAADFARAVVSAILQGF